MSQAVLAERLGVTPAAVSQLERAELTGGVTIARLRQAAAALDCEFVYALVPRTTLTETVTRQARRVAAEQLSYVATTMALEDQAVSVERQSSVLETQARELIAKGLIWPRPAKRPRNP